MKADLVFPPCCVPSESLPAIYKWESEILKEFTYYLVIEGGHKPKGIEIKEGKLMGTVNNIFPLTNPSWTRVEAGARLTLIQE
jgi:hypothetical protein